MTHKKKVFLLLTILFFASNAALAQKEGQIASTPQQAITYFFDGLSEVNDQKMRTHLTSDFLLLEDGAVWTADSLSKSMARLKGADFKRKNSFRYIRTEQTGNSAMLAYHNRADITFNGRAIIVEWLESAQVIKQGKAWKIKLLHSTKLKPKTE